MARDSSGRELTPGTVVRTLGTDIAGHVRLPRYASGKVGNVVERRGRWLHPDESARRLPQASMGDVYLVSFEARELYGPRAERPSDRVLMDLWDIYLQVDPDASSSFESESKDRCA